MIYDSSDFPQVFCWARILLKSYGSVLGPRGLLLWLESDLASDALVKNSPLSSRRTSNEETVVEFGRIFHLGITANRCNHTFETRVKFGSIQALTSEKQGDLCHR